MSLAFQIGPNCIRNPIRKHIRLGVRAALEHNVISTIRIMFQDRLAQVLKTIFHQCVISYTSTCSHSNSDGSVLKQSHQS